MKYIILTLALTLAPYILQAQTITPDKLSVTAEQQDTTLSGNILVVPPLFDYPAAPDNLPDIQSRANWIMQNFWNPFDFTQASVSQAALDHAFNVYITPLRWADAKIAEKSIDDLVTKLKKHTPMLYQFTTAAEHNLYGPKSEMWVDGAYMKFVNALLADKKLSEIRKARFKLQHATLETSLIGSPMHKFEYITPSGKKEKIEFSTPYTIIEFGDPFCNECAMYKINMETYPELSTMIADGKLNFYFIVPDGESSEGWERQLAVYPSDWKRGAGIGLDEKYDIRQMPSVYLLGENGVIIDKFISTSALKQFLTDNILNK